MVGEVVALEAERADPDERGEVHPAERVERRHAGLAPERRVRDGRHVWMRPDRRN